MPNRKKTTLGVIHVTATPPGWKGTMATLKKMHQALGWNDTGYNEVIFPDGRAEISGRGKLGVGAHVAGFNSIAYGLSLVGGVDASGKPDVKTITAAQWSTLERRMRELSQEFPGIAWCGHRDLSPDKDGDGIIEPYEHMKACPVFDAIPYAESLGLKGAAIKGVWAKAPPVKGAEIVAYIGPDTRNAYLQRLLSRAGYQFGPVDGIVGGKTKKAIKAFQSAQKLKQSGAFDAATVARLRELYEGKAAPAVKPAAKAKPADIGHNGGPALAQPKKASLLGGLVGGIVVDVLGGKIVDALKREVGDDNSPITRDKAPEIAGRIIEHVVPAVVEQIAPKVEREVEKVAANAGNDEKWYQSRVILGLLGSLVVLVLGFLGITVDEAMQTEITDGIQAAIVAITGLVAVAGQLYSLYGRLRGKELKPLFSGK